MMQPSLYLNVSDEVLLEQLANVAFQLGFFVSPSENAQDLIRNIDPDDRGAVVLHSNESVSTVIPEIREIKRNFPKAEILVLAANWRCADVVRAIREGATDVLDLPASDEVLRQVFDDMIARDARNKATPVLTIPLDIANTLNHQEFQVLSAILEGQCAKRISCDLDLSIRTIHYRKKSILQKLGVTCRSEAIELIRRAQPKNERAQA